MKVDAFSRVAATPEGHFTLYFYAAILKVVDRLVQVSESQESIFEQFPFLVGYINELAQIGLDGISTADAPGWWQERLQVWEAGVSGFLPIRALQRAAGFSYDTLVMYFCLGLCEEDARFGPLFEVIQGAPGQRHMTVGLFNSWLMPDEYEHTGLYPLQVARMVQVIDPTAPHVEWALEPSPLLWDVITGRGPGRLEDWATYREPDALQPLDKLILSPGLRAQVEKLSSLLAHGELENVLVRGPMHNGRKTLLGAVAHAANRGVLSTRQISSPDDERWHLVGPLATLLNAMPVLTYELAPGETAVLPHLYTVDGPVGIVLGRQGGVRTTRQTLTLNVEMPSLDARRLHWQSAFEDREIDDLDAVCNQFHLTSGGIYHTADLACTYASLANRDTVTLADVQQAARALNRQTLETLTSLVPSFGDWSGLAVSGDTLQELKVLESRCRYREHLPANVSPSLSAQMTIGVRALFTGPSGTGKTLAARILASMLNMDLYRVDLSSVVNKYIGETEKNLNELFSRAEELDVILLIDEGDALLTQRTNVHTSNDRYANLETNFLLQRLESYTGIVIVTTNASDRIDSAFQRRMDIVVEFRAPEAAERWAIWNIHLPAQHRIDQGLLRDVTVRCTLTGGQIRNIMLHASTLALNDGGVVTSAHLEAAVQREYRKMGSVYPLRARNGQPGLVLEQT